MPRVGTLVIAILLVALLTALCVFTQASVIEGDLRLRAQAALRNRGLDQLEVRLDGRDLTLAGALTAGDDRASVLEAAAVEGVRLVHDELRDLTADDLWLRLQVSAEEGAVLRGIVADAAALRELRNAAETWFRGRAIDDRLRTANLESADGPATLVLALMPWVDLLEPVVVEATPTRILIGGRSRDPGLEESLDSLLGTLFEGDAEIDLEPPQESAPRAASSSREAAFPLPPEGAGCGALDLEGLASSLAFEKWSPRLAEGDLEKLEALAALWRSCPERGLLILGFSDRRSRDSVDRELARERARAVWSRLVARGIPRSKLIMEPGVGEVRREGSWVLGAVSMGWTEGE